MVVVVLVVAVVVVVVGVSVVISFSWICSWRWSCLFELFRNNKSNSNSETENIKYYLFLPPLYGTFPKTAY